MVRDISVKVTTVNNIWCASIIDSILQQKFRKERKGDGISIDEQEDTGADRNKGFILELDILIRRSSSVVTKLR